MNGIGTSSEYNGGNVNAIGRYQADSRSLDAIPVGSP
jgi:hypothetical protein